MPLCNSVNDANRRLRLILLAAMLAQAPVAWSQETTRTLPMEPTATSQPPSGATTQFADDYRVDVGDILDFSVTGIADLRQRLTVDVTGRIQVPLAGTVRAAGLSLTELQSQVRDALSTNFYQQRLPDGRNAQVVISRDEVTLRMIEYRPIYLIGDVARPGETAFRPGMTVLQAVSLGGGYDVQRFRMSNPIMDSIDLRSEIDVLRQSLARAQLLIMRLEAEAANASNFTAAPTDVAVPAAVFQELVRIEVGQFTLRQTEYNNEQASIERLLRQTDIKLNTLIQQQSREEEGARADASESDRLRELVRTGIANTARAVETRRVSLLSSTRALQTSVEVEQTRREQEELRRRAQTATARRNIDILRELQEAQLQAATARSRLVAASEKALYTGTLRSQLTRRRGGRPEITVVRQNAEGRHRMIVGEDMLLLPGDVVDVALMLE